MSAYVFFVESCINGYFQSTVLNKGKTGDIRPWPDIACIRLKNQFVIPVVPVPVPVPTGQDMMYFSCHR